MAEPTPAPGTPLTREDWIGKVRKAAGALDGFADRSENKAAIEPLRELAEACRWAASRLTVENPAALPVAAPPAVTPDWGAATWHAGQMALYHRLETLAKADGREAGLIAEMRLKAEMHRLAASALGTEAAKDLVSSQQRAERAEGRLREISDLLADAGVPGGTTIYGGVLMLRERAEKAEARAVTQEQLRSIEWAIQDEDGGLWCPACRSHAGVGHQSDCWLGIALGGPNG